LEKYAGGGGDLRLNEEAEIETASTLAAPEAAVAPVANVDAGQTETCEGCFCKKTSPTKAGKAAAASGRRTPPSTLAQGSEKYAGGRGDLRPNEEAEIEIATLAAPEAAVAPVANADAGQGD
jgi:hypothetical protein